MCSISLFRYHFIVCPQCLGSAFLSLVKIIYGNTLLVHLVLLKRMKTIPHNIVLLYKKLQDAFFVKQIFFFKVWLLKNSTPNRAHFWLETKLVSKMVSFRKAGKNERPSFIFCEVGRFNNALKKIYTQQKPEDKESWVKIFTHSQYEIYENKTTINGGVAPLRFGLDKSELRTVFTLARDTLSAEVLSVEHKSSNVSERLQQICDVDVTLWVGGALRGSQIVFDRPFDVAVVEATRRACNDVRFSKIQEHELPYTRIEIVLIHKLTMPLLHKEIQQGSMCHDKAYYAKTGNNEGWYVPPVFNCIRFNSLSELVQRLYVEKLNMDFTQTMFKDVYLYEVTNYIEDTLHKNIFSLNGSIPEIVALHDSLYISGNSCIAYSLGYLERVQNKEGDFAVIVDPLAGVVIKSDTVRLSFTTYALLMYGASTNNTQSKAIGGKSFEYLKRQIDFSVQYDATVDVLTFIYLARAAHIVNDRETYTRCKSVIDLFFTYTVYEPITYSQYAVLLLSEEVPDMQKVFSVVSKVWSTFLEKEKKEDDISLAAYAELPKLLLIIASYKNNQMYKKESDRIISWYLEKQHEDGSFPTTTTNAYSYIRGTAKILEVLAEIGATEAQLLSVKKGLVWCLNMQYNKENSYFISKKNQEYCYGGFRHDYYNHEIWIDGIAHVLISWVHVKSAKQLVGFDS